MCFDGLHEPVDTFSFATSSLHIPARIKQENKNLKKDLNKTVWRENQPTVIVRNMTKANPKTQSSTTQQCANNNNKLILHINYTV